MQAGTGGSPKLQPNAREHAAPSGSLKFGVGPGVGTIRLQIAEPPEAGDTIAIEVTTAALKTVLVLPDGRRISGPRTAEAAGLSWSETPNPAPIGSTDGGRSTAIYFGKRGAAGRYLLEFTARDLRRQEAAEARFISRRKQYFDVIQDLPGVVLPAPFALGPSAVVAFNLDRDEETSLLDIVVPDSSVKVTLKLPDGRILQPGQKPGRGVEWKTVARREDIDPAGSWFGIGGFLLPVEGTHHVISLEMAPKGRYEIQAVRAGGKGGELRTAFIPLARVMAAATDELRNAGRPAPGEVWVRSYDFPQHCYAGDKLDLRFHVEGDVAPASLRIDVKLELRSYLPRSGGGPLKLGPPVVETIPAGLTPDQNGAYHASIVPKIAGVARVLVSVSGKKISGAPFEEGIVLDLNVSALVARFLSLKTNPVDADGNGKFDRLDITAMLDVFVPGDYDMNLELRDPASKGLLSHCKATLEAGRQQITMSIPARRMRSELKDGPYTISALRIYREKGNYGDDVGIGQRVFHTPPLKRDQWEPAPIQGGEQATIRGIRPAASGRFRFAEVEWSVTTPGGDCYWNASLTPVRPVSAVSPTDLYVQGKLPAGRSRLSLVFPGAGIARAGSRELTFSALVACQGMETRDGEGSSPFLTLTVDPAQFEPPTGSLEVQAQTMLRLPPGGSGGGTVDVPGKKLRDVRFTLKNVPAEVTAILDTRQPDRAAQADVIVNVRPTAAPGRYFIGVAASSAGGTAETELVVEVIP